MFDLFVHQLIVFAELLVDCKRSKRSGTMFYKFEKPRSWHTISNSSSHSLTPSDDPSNSGISRTSITGSFTLVAETPAF